MPSCRWDEYHKNSIASYRCLPTQHYTPNEARLLYYTNRMPLKPPVASTPRLDKGVKIWYNHYRYSLCSYTFRKVGPMNRHFFAQEEVPQERQSPTGGQWQQQPPDDPPPAPKKYSSKPWIAGIIIVSFILLASLFGGLIYKGNSASTPASSTDTSATPATATPGSTATVHVGSVTNPDGSITTTHSDGSTTTTFPTVKLTPAPADTPVPGSCAASPSQCATPSGSGGQSTFGSPVVVSDTWTVTVNSAKTSQGTDFDMPKPGDTFLVVNVTVKNTTAQTQLLSSMYNFTLKDSTGQSYNEDGGCGSSPDYGTPAMHEGNIAAGDQTRGTIAYEVPATLHAFTLQFMDGMTDDMVQWSLRI
jgi:Domain of unknown function (DUF4352)